MRTIVLRPLIVLYSWRRVPGSRGSGVPHNTKQAEVRRINVPQCARQRCAHAFCLARAPTRTPGAPTSRTMPATQPTRVHSESRRFNNVGFIDRAFATRGLESTTDQATEGRGQCTGTSRPRFPGQGARRRGPDPMGRLTREPPWCRLWRLRLHPWAGRGRGPVPCRRAPAPVTSLADHGLPPMGLPLHPPQGEERECVVMAVALGLTDVCAGWTKRISSCDHSVRR